MARIQGFKRIVKESLPKESQDLADTVGASVNPFAEEVINAFNNNLTVTDNLNMQYKDIEVKVNANGIPSILTQYKSTLRTKTKGIIVIRAENLTNPLGYALSTPFVSYVDNGVNVTLGHVSGLIPNNIYRLTLLSTG